MIDRHRESDTYEPTINNTGVPKIMEFANLTKSTEVSQAFQSWFAKSNEVLQAFQSGFTKNTEVLKPLGTVSNSTDFTPHWNNSHTRKIALPG